MLKRFKIRLIKKYIFELDGKDESDIRNQLDYIDTKTKLLDMPYVSKKVKIKIRKSKKKKYNKK